MKRDTAFLQAVEEIDAVLPDERAELAVTASFDDLCELFNRVKGPVENILPVVEHIPVYGSTIAKALRLLLQLGNLACPK
jgi:hypothetical protein